MKSISPREGIEMALLAGAVAVAVGATRLAYASNRVGSGTDCTATCRALTQRTAECSMAAPAATPLELEGMGLSASAPRAPRPTMPSSPLRPPAPSIPDGRRPSPPTSSIGEPPRDTADDLDGRLPPFTVDELRARSR